MDLLGNFTLAPSVTSVKNPANNTLNETKVNSLKPTSVLPKSLPAPCCIALLDDHEEQGLWFLEAKLWHCRHVDLHNPLKLSEECLEHHVCLLVLGPCIAVNCCLVLPKGFHVRW